MTLPAGPTAHPVVQLAHWLRRPLPFLDECAASHGEAFTVRFPGFPPLVMLAHPDAVREVFAASPDDMHAGEANVVLRPFLGQHSLLMLDGAEHLRQRKLLLPPFHGERMQAYGRQMLETAQASIDSWPLGAPFPIHRPMQAITLDIILRTIFGLEDRARLDALSSVVTRTLDLAAWPPLLLPWLQVDLGPLSPWGRYARLSARADAAIFDLVRARRRAGTAGRTDVLSMLLDARDEAGQPMTDQELRDELVTLLVAGHETTATALSWTFRWLLERPELWRRLREEVEGASPGGALAPERLARLELLDATVRETLRLQPVIPMVGRLLKRPVRIAGLALPAGVVAVPSIYLASRRPAAFPEPARFRPERFVGVKASPFEWFPFGGGVRRCIGMAFALYEMKLVLAAVLARVELRAAPGRRVRVVRRSITLSPSDGMRVVAADRRPRRPVAAAG